MKKITHVLEKISRRPTDLIARYGGEEFIILLPETDNKEAVKLAENCRIAVSNQELPHEQPDASEFVSISIGVNTVIPSEDISPSSFIEGADRLLYKAKDCGRNRVEF